LESAAAAEAAKDMAREVRRKSLRNMQARAYYNSVG